MPRQVMMTPQVTPKGKFTFGHESGFHLSSSALEAFEPAIVDAIDAVNGDTVEISSETLENAAHMAIAQGVDPIGLTSNWHLAYGFARGFEAGYEYMGSGALGSLPGVTGSGW